MSRLYAWIQRHPKLIDALPALFLLLVGVGTDLSSSFESPLHRVLVVPLIVAIVVPLVFRRRWPRGAFAVAAVAAFVGFFGGKMAFTPADLAFLIYVYTVAAYRQRRWSIPAMVLTWSGALIQLALVGAYTDSRDCDTVPESSRTDCLRGVGSFHDVGKFNWSTFLIV